MRFSIITITYNAETTLEETLRSVEAQEFRDFEHLLIDGGSRDKTVEIAKRFLKVKIFEGKDEGISDAMNKGARLASGDFLIHLHADDTFLHSKVLSYIDTFLKQHPQTRWCYGLSKVVDGAGKVIKVPNFKPFSLEKLKKYNTISHPSTVISKELFWEAGGFNKELAFCMDYDLWLRLAHLTLPLAFPVYLTAFREHEGSLSTAMPLKVAREAFEVRKKYAKTLFAKYRSYRTLKKEDGFMQLIEKLLERIILKTKARRVYFIYTHKNGKSRFKRCLNANSEISFFSYNALKKAFGRTIFLKMEGEKDYRIQSIRPQDVVIGHMGETYLKASRQTKNLIAFQPWAGNEDRSTNTLFNCMPKEKELGFWEKAQSLVLLTSEYNLREYIEKERNFWYREFGKLKQEKRVQIVHQPIDLTVFKRIKWDYKTSNFLYIGNNAHMKGLDMSRELVKRVERKLFLYGVEGKKLDHRDKKAVLSLSQEADFFIQPGMWEAQSVAILEAQAYGFIPIVTEETGYPYKHPFLLRYGDFDYNLKVLKELLNTSEKDRRLLADDLWHQLANDPKHNSWKMLTDVLIDEVKSLN